MDTNRVEDEIEVLRQRYTVHWNTELSGIIIADFHYPDGWEPEISPLLVRLPNTYPKVQPAIYIPQQLRYTRGSVTHRTKTDLMEKGWVRWCIHQAWDPHDDHIVRMLELLMASLREPAKGNPYARASKR